MVVNPFEQIYKSAEKFLTPLTLEETYSNIIRELLKLSKSYLGVIVIYKKGEANLVYSSNNNFPLVHTRKKGFTYQAFKQGKPLIVNYEDVIKVHPVYKEKGFRWSRSIFIPLSYSRKKLGVVILIQKRENYPNKKQLNILKVFSSLATMAIRKTQLSQEIKDALDARELFISMAAHELKTPLTTINAYVQLLQKKHLNQEINAKWIDQLGNATQRLKKLVSELLQIEQIKKGELIYQMENVNLLEIINQAIDDFKFFNTKHKLLFIDKLDHNNNQIYADYDKLLQVFNNILNNSAKFSNPSSKITITLRYKEPDFIIQVQDQGAGISQEDLPNIFNKFYKGKHKNREGLGLGLFLTKKIINRHQGKIFIKSNNNKGTIFQIMLPKKSHDRISAFSS